MLCVQPRERCPLTYHDNNYCKIKYHSVVLLNGSPFSSADFLVKAQYKKKVFIPVQYHRAIEVFYQDV